MRWILTLTLVLFCCLAISCKGAPSVDAELALWQRIGHHVKLAGVAGETSDYGAHIMHGNRLVFIEGMTSWPWPEVSGKLVVVSGILDAPFKPVGSETGASGVIDSFVLRDASWHLAKE